MKHSRRSRWLAALCAALACLALLSGCGAKHQRESLMTLAMDTVIRQDAYGPNATAAMQAVSDELVTFEERLSLFHPGSEIQAVNAAAGRGGAEVSAETASLISRALDLSAGSDGAFAVTIAPLTLAWGIGSDSPRVVPQEELDRLVPLVNDSAVEVEGNHITLPTEGMGIDLGGIAKGEACSLARDIYEQHGVDSAMLSVGGNVYARGTKPDGDKWTVGFRNPAKDAQSYIATVLLADEVIAVSGGYERYFEQDGKRYIHILNPRTGQTAESDILSVGVIHPDGAAADFYSTTLFVKGLEAALDYMRGGGRAIALDNENTLYVSAGLEADFALYEEVTQDYEVVYIPGDGA